MADASDYESHTSLQAAAFVTALPKRQELKVISITEQIAKQPDLGRERIPQRSPMSQRSD